MCHGSFGFTNHLAAFYLVAGEGPLEGNSTPIEGSTSMSLDQRSRQLE